MWHSESQWEYQWAHEIGGLGVKTFIRVESESLWPEISAAIVLYDGPVNHMVIKSVRTFGKSVNGSLQYLAANDTWKPYALKRLEITIRQFPWVINTKFCVGSQFFETAHKVINKEIDGVISLIRKDVRGLDRNESIITQYVRVQYRLVSRLTDAMLSFQYSEKAALKDVVKSFLYDALLDGLIRLSIFLESEFHKYIDQMELLSVPARNILVYSSGLVIPKIRDRYAGVADASLILKLLRPLDEIVYNSACNITQKKALHYKRYVYELMSIDPLVPSDHINTVLHQIYLRYIHVVER